MIFLELSGNQPDFVIPPKICYFFKIRQTKHKAQKYLSLHSVSLSTPNLSNLSLNVLSVSFSSVLILLFVESSYADRVFEVVDMKAHLEADVALMSHRVCVLVLLTESRHDLVSQSLGSL